MDKDPHQGVFQQESARVDLDQTRHGRAVPALEGHVVAGDQVGDRPQSGSETAAEADAETEAGLDAGDVKNLLRVAQDHAAVKIAVAERKVLRGHLEEKRSALGRGRLGNRRFLGHRTEASRTRLTRQSRISALDNKCFMP